MLTDSDAELAIRISNAALQAIKSNPHMNKKNMEECVVSKIRLFGVDQTKVAVEAHRLIQEKLNLDLVVDCRFGPEEGFCADIFMVPEDNATAIRDIIFDYGESYSDVLGGHMLMPMTHSIEVTKEYYPEHYKENKDNGNA